MNHLEDPSKDIELSAGSGLYFTKNWKNIKSFWLGENDVLKANNH